MSRITCYGCEKRTRHVPRLTFMKANCRGEYNIFFYCTRQCWSCPAARHSILCHATGESRLPPQQHYSGSFIDPVFISFSFFFTGIKWIFQRKAVRKHTRKCWCHFGLVRVVFVDHPVQRGPQPLSTDFSSIDFCLYLDHRDTYFVKCEAINKTYNVYKKINKCGCLADLKVSE